MAAGQHHHHHGVHGGHHHPPGDKGDKELVDKENIEMHRQASWSQDGHKLG